ncbi:sigma 54-interacting transcriptional regulator [Clostridiaceae bacterium M8S5]|nr:sigma 54-interacting transcriptional regulator [Clostridiaceae bacterium M8S5]
MKIKNLILKNIKLIDLMQDDIFTSSINTKTNDMLERMVAEDKQNVIITDSDKIFAMLSLMDILKAHKSGIKIRDYIKNNNKYLKFALYKENSSIDLINILQKESEIEAIPILDRDKRPIGLIDETQIRRLYSLLIDKSYVLFNNIIDNLHDAICVVDEDSRVLLWNQSAQKLYKIAEDEIVDKLITDKFPTALLPKVIAQKKEYRNIYNNPRENCYDIISATPLYDGHKCIGAVSCDMDISELFRISKLLNDAMSNISMLENEVSKLNESRLTLSQIKTKNTRLKSTIKLCKNISKSKVNILISGESGTGKEVLSRAIHIESSMKGHFVSVECDKSSQEDLKKELFGSNNMKSSVLGKLQLADKGTLFLDEVGELPLSLQDDILKIIDNKIMNIDIRVIAATSDDLRKKVNKGLFREELFHRLSSVNVYLPSLKERKEDIPMLVNKFVREFCITYRKNIVDIPSEIMDKLKEHEYIGNIRELRNTIERIVISSQGNNIDRSYINGILQKEEEDSYNSKTLDLTKILEKAELKAIKQALKITNYNKMRTSKLLNIPRSTLYFKMKKHNLE